MLWHAFLFWWISLFYIIKYLFWLININRIIILLRESGVGSRWNIFNKNWGNFYIPYKNSLNFYKNYNILYAARDNLCSSNVARVSQKVGHPWCRQSLIIYVSLSRIRLFFKYVGELQNTHFHTNFVPKIWI